MKKVNLILAGVSVLLASGCSQMGTPDNSSPEIAGGFSGRFVARGNFATELPYNREGGDGLRSIALLRLDGGGGGDRVIRVTQTDVIYSCPERSYAITSNWYYDGEGKFLGGQEVRVPVWARGDYYFSTLLNPICEKASVPSIYFRDVRDFIQRGASIQAE